MNEKEFWKCTPRKLFMLIDAHNRANSEEEEGEPELLTLEELIAMR
jgi:hypothetical protein